MARKKAPPRDFEADKRFAPPPEDASPEELMERGHALAKAVLGGAGVGREPED